MYEAIVLAEKAPSLRKKSKTLVEFMRAHVACERVDDDGCHPGIRKTDLECPTHHRLAITLAEVTCSTNPDIDSPEIGLTLAPVVRLFGPGINDLHRPYWPAAEFSHEVAATRPGNLIAASKVSGTHVYNSQGDNLGMIYDVMIDKRSGDVAYAVMSFGGFLGIGEEYSPLPWSALTFDVGQGGYVVDIEKDALKAGPRYTDDDFERWEDPEYTREIDDY